MEKHNDNLFGLAFGIIGGAVKWTLTIESQFLVKLTEATIIAFICGLAGIAGKEFWYYLKKKFKF